MKKSFNITKKLGRKNIILSVVALVLIALVTIGATYSWIEEVSEIKFTTDNDSQQTPLHITANKLKSTAIISESTSSIDLSEYFAESGDMHLSPCYSDGETFHFIERSNTGQGYRLGTKDDANVNYISVTFKVRSDNANTVYWFEKKNSNTPFFTVKNSAGTAQENTYTDNLRCSITVDNATTVYVNNPGQNTADATSSYKYYDGSDVQTGSSAPTMQSYSYDSNLNHGGGTINGHNNTYGNTLFSVGKYDSENAANTIKTVTVKIWLEYSTSDPNMGGNLTGSSSAKLSDINLKLVSSWAKTRTIKIKDKTVNYGGKLSNVSGVTKAGFAARNDSDKVITASNSFASNPTYPWIRSKTSGSDSEIYSLSIPAVYNNLDVYALLMGDSLTSGGSNTLSVTSGSSYKPYYYWKTTLPDTYCDETYTLYTDQFGTWANSVNYIKFLNSCNYTFNNYTTFPDNNIKAYMWDSNYGSGTSDKVVQNASWPGIDLTRLSDTVHDFKVFGFYYDVDTVFNSIIINDGFHGGGGDNGGTDGYAHAYQTPDITLDNSKKDYYFDMATLHFYNGASNCPNHTDYFLYNNFVTGNEFRVTRFMNSGTKYNNHDQYYCRAYFKAANNNGQHYEFKISYKGQQFWGRHNSGDDIFDGTSNGRTGNLWEGLDTSAQDNRQFYKSTSLSDENCVNLLMYVGTSRSVCTFYWVPDLNRLWVEYNGTNYSVYS